MTIKMKNTTTPAAVKITTPSAGTQIKSSSGGTITFTPTGLIHTCGRNYNSSNVAHCKTV